MSTYALDVVGLGFSSLDMVGLASALPEIDRGTTLTDITRQGGGPVAQAMVTVARLGGRVGYVGRLADDEAGLVMRQQLLDEGVDLDQLQVEEGSRSPECLILVHEPTGKRSICCYRGTVGRIDLQHVDAQYLTSGRYLHLDGIDRDAALWAARIARDRGTAVCLDAGGPSEDLMELVPYVDVLIAAESFVQAHTETSEMGAGTRALQRMGPTVVVATRGEKGSYSQTDRGSFHTPQFQVDVVDTTGAGDVFHGAYIYGLVQGWGYERIAEFAGAAAALKCRVLGGRAGIPGLAEVTKFLAQSPAGSSA